MLHTKFHGNQSTGSVEEDCKGFTIYGNGGHLGQVNSIIFIFFYFHVPQRFQTKFG